MSVAGSPAARSLVGGLGGAAARRPVVLGGGEGVEAEQVGGGDAAVLVDWGRGGSVLFTAGCGSAGVPVIDPGLLTGAFFLPAGLRGGDRVNTFRAASGRCWPTGRRGVLLPAAVAVDGVLPRGLRGGPGRGLYGDLVEGLLDPGHATGAVVELLGDLVPAFIPYRSAAAPTCAGPCPCASSPA